MNAHRGIFRSLQILLAAIATQACLSHSYQLGPEELHRLVNVDPERRGENVRVTQQTQMGDDRKTSETEPPPPEYDSSGARGYHYVHGGGFAIAHTSHNYYFDDDDDSSSSDDSAALALAAVVAIAAIAGGAAIMGAAIEGSRFDGYVKLAPDHPVLLLSNSGQQTWKPLYDLTSSDVSLTKRAIVSRHDGVIDEVQRAPLDRVGFGYQFEAGAAQLMTPYGAADRGFSMRAALGYAPWQQVGFYWGGQFVAGDVALAPANEAFALNLRTFAQVEYWPLAVSRLHAGLFGEVGIGKQLLDEATATRSLLTPSFGAGLALQLDVTTRLAVTLRGAAMLWPDGSVPLAKSVAPALTLGVAVY